MYGGVKSLRSGAGAVAVALLSFCDEYHLNKATNHKRESILRFINRAFATSLSKYPGDPGAAPGCRGTQIAVALVEEQVFFR